MTHTSQDRIDENEILLSLPDPIQISGKIIKVNKWGKERNGKHLVRAKLEVEHGYADQKKITISGYFSGDNKNDIIDHHYLLTGQYMSRGSKNDNSIYFSCKKVQEDDSISLFSDQKSGFTKPVYQSVIITDQWMPSDLKPDYDVHLKGFSENLSGIGDGFVKQVAFNRSFIDFMKTLLNQPQILLLNQNQKTAVDKVNRLSDYVKQKLSNPRTELCFLMRLAGFQKRQISKVAGTDSKPVQISEINKYIRNPYALLEVFPTLAVFSRCDFIALMLNQRSDNLNRYQGLILAQVADAINNGNICLREDAISDLITKSDRLNKISAFNDVQANILPPQVLRSLIDKMIKADLITVDVYDGKDYLYLPEFENQEKYIASNILKRTRKSGTLNTWVHYSEDEGKWVYGEEYNGPVTNTDIDKYIEWYEQTTHFKLADMQKMAVAMVLKNRISLLAGGAGYGKTATTAAIVQAIRFFWRFQTIDSSWYYKHQDDDLDVSERRDLAVAEWQSDYDDDHAIDNELVRMAGSTGRAAQQMMISLKKCHIQEVNASTIHSLYRIRPGDPDSNSDHRVDSKFVIIDESSMIDLPLMYSILKRTDMDTHLLFIGDPNQLPSVGPGRVFRDLIDSDKVPKTILNKLFRTGAGSLIALNSSAILKGYNIQTTTYQPQQIASVPLSETSIWINGQDQNDINRSILAIVREKIKQGYTADQLAVMSPEHGTSAGVDQLNIDLQNMLNPIKPAIDDDHLSTLSGFRPGDRVMQIRNDWTRNVINGDKGKIIEICKGKHGRPAYALVKMDEHDKPVRYDYSTDPDENQFTGLRLGYAGTVHKYQGDSGLICICAVSKSMTYFLDRTLMYTAATRAIKQMIFVGDRRCFMRAIHKVKDRSRTSLLKQRLLEEVTRKEGN